MNKKDFVFNEKMAQTPLCVYPNVSKVAIIGEKLSCLKSEINRHKVEPVLVGNISEIKEIGYNIIYGDSSIKKDEIDSIYTLLCDDGICVFSSDSWNSEEYKKELKSFGKFRFVIPFGEGFIFASKKYHPTADLRLQTVDLLDGLNYYNSDIHLSLFALPNYVYNNLKPYIKL